MQSFSSPTIRSGYQQCLSIIDTAPVPVASTSRPSLRGPLHQWTQYNPCRLWINRHTLKTHHWNGPFLCSQVGLIFITCFPVFFTESNLSTHGLENVLQRGHKVTAGRFAQLRGLGLVRGGRFDVRGMPGDFLREALGPGGGNTLEHLEKAPKGNVISNIYNITIYLHHLTTWDEQKSKTKPLKK